MNTSFLHQGLMCNNSEKDTEQMQQMLNLDPRCLERVCVRQGFTPLCDAADSGHDRCFQFLVNCGANTNSECKGSDLMKISIGGSNKRIVMFLLNHGYSPNYNPMEDEIVGVTYYLHLAASEHHVSIMKLLIEYGAQVDDFQNFNLSFNKYYYFAPSVTTIHSNCSDGLKLLLLNGAKVDHKQLGIPNPSAKVIDCLSLIHHFAVATFYQLHVQKAILNILYQFGANLWQKNRHGLTPLEVRLNSEVWLLERRRRKIDEDSDDDLDPEDFMKINENLRELMGKPLSLLSLSRIAIVQAMGSEYFRSLHKLPTLPRQVKAFLRACDLQTTE